MFALVGADCNSLHNVISMNNPESIESQVKLQICLAERNCDRRTRATMYAAVTSAGLGLYFIWYFGISPEWLMIIGAFGGVIGFVIYEANLKQRAVCPCCGGSWEMRGLGPGFMPIGKFYLKECPFCKLKI